MKIDVDRHVPTPDKKPLEAVAIEKIDFDEHGLPQFGSLLKDRPTRRGEQFEQVYLRDKRPVKSLKVAIVSNEAEHQEPLDVLYKWTGKGFSAVMDATCQIGRAGSPKDLLADEVFCIFVMPVVATATGAVIGVSAAFMAELKEITNTVLGKKETIVNYTEYEYDDQARLKRMKIFLPDSSKTELVRTEYQYDGSGTVPVITTVHSFVDNKTRTIP